MQILGKRSKVLLIVIAVAMLVAVGVSFAIWDTSAVKATNGNLSDYANAKVGDIIEFGQYYQTGKRVNNDENGEYEKTPIEWIVVDKNERTGQLTLMSKYILAAGSYFGNYYWNQSNSSSYLYQMQSLEVGGVPYNQAYLESTVRAYLNNLERRDLGGDSYESSQFKTSAIASSTTTGVLLTSVGFSNRKYLISNSLYQRPITNSEYRNRPATRGFYDEAFTLEEKTMIMPKEISGYTGFRWPTNSHELSQKTYVEGVKDKIWLPSATELNITNIDDNYTNPNDEISSNVFDYFRSLADADLKNALKAERTQFLKTNSKAMNSSIPLYKYQSTEINEDINITLNSIDYYWTRSPMSRDYFGVRAVTNSGSFYYYNTDDSRMGIRPCMIIKY